MDDTDKAANVSAPNTNVPSYINVSAAVCTALLGVLCCGDGQWAQKVTQTFIVLCRMIVAIDTYVFSL